MMFDFSFLELLLITVIALLVVGPDRLPTLVRTIGLWVGRGRALATSLRSEFEREVNAAGIKETERRFREEMTQADRELRDATSAADTTADSEDASSASQADREAQNPADAVASTEAPDNQPAPQRRRDDPQ